MSIVGDRLTIAIPETWLADASYPVIVDPVIGTSTVGSQTEWYDPDNEDYNEVYVELSLIANRYLIPETFNGTAQAYVYAWFDDYDGRCKPVLYSDNNNVPLTRKSALEGNFDIEVSRNKPAGWRSTPFSTNGSIAAGTYIWYALFCDFFCIRFDFGAKCYWELRGNGVTEIPNTFPVGSPNSYYDFKVSMYFSYTSAQHYTRTLTQGVNLSDTRKLTADYKKTLVMNGQNTTDLGHGSSYYREHSAQVRGADTVPWLRGFYRNISETIQIRNPLGYCQDFLRQVLETAKAFTDTGRNNANRRTVLTTGGSNDGITQGRGFFRSVLTISQSGDTNNSMISLTRNIAEWAAALESAGHQGDYIRGLYVTAGSIAETDHAADYYRKQEDTAYSEAIPLRSLFMVIRLVTVGLVRDFILKRFLKSNEDIVLKSPVCREIEIDSRIH
ncbi:hypothetical protein AGMMS50268_38340 [Spirochaetia bacterium]|nr:hypothetical protein AGMMS50268_38340 [Spirochaetia bacterium]